MQKQYSRTIGNFSKLPTDILLDAMDTVLTEKQREYCLDYFGLLLSMKEVASKHGVSTATVSRTISRAKKRLHGVLKYYKPK